MTRNRKEISERQPVCIGQIIKEELHRQERSVAWFSRKIHCDRRNVYDIFERTSIDTDLLYRISLILNTDFFAHFSTTLQIFNNQSLTPPTTSRLRNPKFSLTTYKKVWIAAS